MASWPALVRALFRAHEPKTVRELGEITGSSRDVLTHQLHHLEGEGVLVRSIKDERYNSPAWSLDWPGRQ